MLTTLFFVTTRICVNNIVHNMCSLHVFTTCGVVSHNLFHNISSHVSQRCFLCVHKVCFTTFICTTYRAHPHTILLSQRVLVHDICSQPLFTTCLFTPTLSFHNTFSQPHVFNMFIHNHTFSARPGSARLGSPFALKA